MTISDSHHGRSMCNNVDVTKHSDRFGEASSIVTQSRYGGSVPEATNGNIGSVPPLANLDVQGATSDREISIYSRRRFAQSNDTQCRFFCPNCSIARKIPITPTAVTSHHRRRTILISSLETRPNVSADHFCGCTDSIIHLRNVVGKQYPDVSANMNIGSTANLA